MGFWDLGLALFAETAGISSKSHDIVFLVIGLNKTQILFNNQIVVYFFVENVPHKILTKDAARIERKILFAHGRVEKKFNIREESAHGMRKNHVKIIHGWPERPQEEFIPRPNEATCLGIQIKIHHTAFCATELICETASKLHANLCGYGVIGIGQGDNEHKMIYYMNQEVVMEEIVQENEEDMEDDFPETVESEEMISNETFLQFDVAKIKEKRENC
ncbi:hypothetical protein ACJX0J_041105, partial [Zea mays]